MLPSEIRMLSFEMRVLPVQKLVVPLTRLAFSLKGLVYPLKSLVSPSKWLVFPFQGFVFPLKGSRCLGNDLHFLETIGIGLMEYLYNPSDPDDFIALSSYSTWGIPICDNLTNLGKHFTKVCVV